MLLARGAYKRDYGNLPELRLVNFFVESTPTSEGGFALQARKGLTSYATWGGGPVNGIFSKSGVFADAIFALAGNSFYVNGVFKGTVNGSGPVSWAASDNEVVITRGGDAYSYNGTNLASIGFPDGADVEAVTYISSRFVFVREGTHQFYWSALLDARTIDDIDFASAEMAPDDLVDVESAQGSLLLVGASSIEAWFPSANADLPYTRTDQRFYTKGAIATGCTAVIDDSLYFIANDSRVYRLAGGLERISHHGIEEKVAASETHSAYHFEHEGHTHFCVRLDTETYAYDLVTGEWWQPATYGRDNWRPKCATNVGPTPYFGDDETNDIWEFTDVFQDDGADLEGYFSAIFPITGGTVSVDNVEVRGNTGSTQPLSGDDANPIIEMRSSRNGGRTFTTWRETSLGAQGEYTTRASFRRCGMFRPPGVLMEFRITDQSPRRISGVFFNEPGGGRN